MSLLPRRRAGQPGQVAVHPGWTLSPPSVSDVLAAPSPEPAPAPAPLPSTQPTSRWTSSPPLPPLPVPQPAVAVPAPVAVWAQAPSAPIATMAPVLVPVPETSWTREWEAVAATPTTPAAPVALHTLQPPARPSLPPPVAALLTALDLPLPGEIRVAEAPLAAQAVAFLQGAAPQPPHPPLPPAPVQRRSTVRLGFTDASVVDLRPDDPIAKALQTVADALIGRDQSRPA